MSNSTITSSEPPPPPPTTSSFTTSSFSEFTSSTVPPASSSIVTSATEASTSRTATSAGTPIATFTSLITVSPTASNQAPSIVTVTSTQSNDPTPTDNLAASASASASRAASSSRAAALATAGASSSNNGGLGTGGRIAIAVVVPIVAIAAIAAALIFFWKKRKARKTAEEERRKEVEEYGYNPNNDPTLPAVGSTYGETQSEMTEDNSGYRGWGTTSTQRKPSTTLGSSRAQVGMAVSDTTSNTGHYNGQPSEGHSGDPLVNSPGHEHGPSDELEPVGALGGAPAAAGQHRDLDRGPSNASSAYTGHRSEGSGDGDRIGSGYAPQQYYDDVGYYNDSQPNHGPYGDGTYGGGQQPVIRDVQARRNTRIEKPSVFPQAGNSGIAQNF